MNIAEPTILGELGQAELFKKEPSYSIWLAELNHERRIFGENALANSSKAKTKYDKLVAQGFWN